MEMHMSHARAACTLDYAGPTPCEAHHVCGGLLSQGIIHRDMKPQNIMLVENDQQSPFRVIDFGSAIVKGSSILMDDYTEIYAPPEAPTPDSRRPVTLRVVDVCRHA